MVNPTDIPRWQAARSSPRATWVLPVQLLPTAITFSRRSKLKPEVKSAEAWGKLGEEMG